LTKLFWVFFSEKDPRGRRNSWGWGRDSETKEEEIEALGCRGGGGWVFPCLMFRFTADPLELFIFISIRSCLHTIQSRNLGLL